MYTARPNLLFSSFFWLVIVLSIPYSNTLHVPWLLDDQPNILDNTAVHLQQFSWSEIKKTFYANPDSPGQFYRPVAVFSLALNWFVGQDNPVGYHVVNLCIHILTAFFLYLACLYLVQLSLPPETFNRSGQFIALLTALLWAINPIQTQAVTYIVQRMAALAALFSIIGILFFLKARTAASVQKRVFSGLCCLVSFFMALGSKENAILFPFSLLLIDRIFLKSYRKILRNDRNKKIFVLFFLFLLIAGYNFFSGICIPGLSYGHRTFTLTQRVLASPYILLFYLSLIFFPSAGRLSIEHDILLPSSLFTHWTTVPSLAIGIFFIFYFFHLRVKKSLFSFAILFYFLNHSVESTVLHLEPFFEHRNYLPSLFLFLPIAAWIAALLDIAQKKYVHAAVVAVSISILIFFGINAYIRNQVWASAMSIWQDALNKAPKSSRAAINLASEYIKLGDTKNALMLSKQAYDLWHPTKNYAQGLSLNGQGVVADIKNDHYNASQLFKQSLEFLPNHREAKNNLILSLCKQHRFEEALRYLENHSNPRREGIILLWLGQAEKSLEKFRSASEILEVENVTGMGKALSMLGQYEQADFYLEQAAPFSPLSSLIRIENLLRAEKLEDAERVTLNMLRAYSAHAVFQHLSIEDMTRIPLDIKIVRPFVFKEAGGISTIKPASN
ncbi:hypothetical protein VU08_03420 [Desulfobulbus sp. F5]|nr:hypothetical protein [Desulfobulbus sp. F5]